MHLINEPVSRISDTLSVRESARCKDANRQTLFHLLAVYPRSEIARPASGRGPDIEKDAATNIQTNPL